MYLDLVHSTTQCTSLQAVLLDSMDSTAIVGVVIAKKLIAIKKMENVSQGDARMAGSVRDVKKVRTATF